MRIYPKCSVIIFFLIRHSDNDSTYHDVYYIVIYSNEKLEIAYMSNIRGLVNKLKAATQQISTDKVDVLTSRIPGLPWILYTLHPGCQTLLQFCVITLSLSSNFPLLLKKEVSFHYL